MRPPAAAFQKCYHPDSVFLRPGMQTFPHANSPVRLAADFKSKGESDLTRLSSVAPISTHTRPSE